MQPKDNRDNFDRRVYQTFTFNLNSVEFRRLPFEFFFVAISPFSGPIAMFLDKSIPSDLTFSPEDEDSILLFSNRGSIFNRVPFYVKDKVVFFQFTSEEVLVLGTTSAYYLIDPYRSSVKMLDMKEYFRSEKVLGYRMVNSRMYVLVGKRVFEIRNLHQPMPKEIAILDLDSENPLVVISAQEGCEDLEILYLHESKQLYSSRTNAQLFECSHLSDPKTRPAYLSRHTTQDSNFHLLILHNPFRICYYINGNPTFYECPTAKIIDQTDNKKGTTSTTRIPGNLCDSGYTCTWIDDTAYVSNKLWVIRLNSRGLNFMRDQQTLISQQIDGIRFYGDNTQIIRLAPPEYLSLFKGSPNQRILSLYEAFEQYQNSTVVNLELLGSSSSKQQFQDYKDKAMEVLDVVIKAAQFSLDPLQQMRILKFGIFFKTYYCINANLNELCESLRLINNLKHQVVSRCLTLAQFRYLKQHKFQEFVAILLRYNLHFVADLVGGGEKVYFHWAKCKIEKQREDIALNSIVNKFNAYKDKNKRPLSYVEIARYAIQTKRFQLAQKLIEYQPSVKRKVMILLWMASLRKEVGFLEKALQNADKSVDSDTIFRVILEVQKQEVPAQSIQKIIDKRPILYNHYVEYLRQNNPNKLKDYYLKKKMTTEVGLLSLQVYFSQKSNTDALGVAKKLLPSVAEAANVPKAAEYSVFLKKAMDPSYAINQTEIQKFVTHKNPEFLVEVLVERGMVDEAVNATFGIPSDTAFDLLIRMEKWKEAISLAKQRKNKNTLQRLLEIAPEEERQSVVLALNQLSQK